jgi:acyl-CoA reductase-like NAD-dependent aldehyde dehydrogenase
VPGDAAAVVTVGAKELLDEFFASSEPGLVHYFGSSGRIADLAAACFRARKTLIADGEGNTWVYVGADCAPEFAAEILASGSTRYNGLTCTSVNGAIVHPDQYRFVRDALLARLSPMEAASVGSEEAAAYCFETLTSAGGDFLAGSHKGAAIKPTLVAMPESSSRLVTEGVFGPGMWIAAGTEDEFRSLWLSNRYPLCAGVLAASVNAHSWVGLPNLARLVINGDPSIEDPLEPWGGYPACGNAKVTGWAEKYSRTVQVDRP